MSGENSIEKAKELYESRSYYEAFDMAIALGENGEERKEALLLAAKSYIQGLPSAGHEDLNNVVLRTVSILCECVESIEELQYIEKGIFSAFYEWEARTLREKIEEVERVPTMENWKSVLPLRTEYLKLKLLLQATTRNCVFATTYKLENDIDDKSFSKIMYECAKGGITAAEISTIKYETATRIFEQTKRFLSQNAHGSVAFANSIINKVVERTILAIMIVEGEIESDSVIETKCERTKMLAEIRRFVLGAMVYVNGTPNPVFSESYRGQVRQKINNDYMRIKGWEPGFIPPALPSVQQVSTQSSSSSSDGCYVATAVYGSYDCPQVWTLRRFRDHTLAETWLGRLFIKMYYAISPTLVKWFGEAAWFKNLWRPTLDRMVRNLNDRGVEDTAYNDRSW